MTEHTLFVDSRYATLRKSSTEFSILMNSENVERDTNNKENIIGTYNDPGEIFRKVISVELTAFTINTTSNLSENNSEHYLILDIDELNNRIVSNVPVANHAFAVMYYKPNETNVQMIKGFDFDPKIRKFDTPLDSLSRLTIHIRPAREYGTPMTYPIADHFDGYFTMIFKIKTAC